MRFVRLLLAAATLLGATSCAEAAANSAGVFVSVSPATVNAGAKTQVQGSCGENVNSATVSSTAFGSVTLAPVGGVLTATVTVAPKTPKGTYGVRLACPTGSQAMTTLTVLNSSASAGANAPGPNTGGGFLAGNEAPADRTPVVWLALGLTCLLAAAAVAVRTQQQPWPRRARGRPAKPHGEPR